jgi:hypothetical protein
MPKGVFTILRDWYNNRAGWDDPKAMDKFVHGEKVKKRSSGSVCLRGN